MNTYITFYLQALFGTALWMIAGYHSIKAITEGLMQPNFVRFFAGIIGITSTLTLLAWAAERTFNV